MASFLSGYTTRRRLTINHTLINSDLFNFPVDVILTGARHNFARGNTGGTDTRFTRADGITLEPYERERHDSVASRAEYKARLPFVSSAAPTHFFFYYRTTTTPDGANPTAVWDANFRARWALREAGAGAVNEFRDSTINANHGQGGGGVAGQVPTQVEGRIGFAQSLDGVDDWIGCGAVGIGGNPSFTIEGWFRFGDSVGEGMIGWGDTIWAFNAVGFWHGLRGTNVISAEFGGGNPAFVNTPVSINVWHHIVFTKTPGAINTTSRFYLNGVDLGAMSVGSSTGTPNIYGTFPLAIGRWANHTGADGFKLQMVDEARISNISRSPAWIGATFHSGNDSLLTYGAEETLALTNTLFFGANF